MIKAGFYLLLTVLACVSWPAQSAERDMPFDMCLKGNADTRSALSRAPSMPEGSKKLAAIVFDDRICQCIRVEDSKVPADETEPMQRYFSANSVCMATHIQKEFPSVCPLAVKDVLASVPVTADEVTAICECAVSEMQTIVTPDALLRSQREQYVYFNALVADRRQGTHTAASLTKPGPGPYERSMQGIAACGKKVLVAATERAKLRSDRRKPNKLLHATALRSAVREQ